MSLAKHDDIAPWGQDQRTYFTYDSEQKEDSPHLQKKFSENLEQIIRNSIAKKKKFNRKRLVLSTSKHTKSLIYHSATVSNSEEQLLSLTTHNTKREMSMEKQKLRRNHMSQTIQTNLQKKQIPIICQFAIKKYRKIGRFFAKQTKIQDIFKKAHQMQNPNSRQNISLPKIEIRI